jgi:hypothetical protein
MVFAGATRRTPPPLLAKCISDPDSVMHLDPDQAKHL